ncbi:MAG: glycosyltransferase [Crocinitomicaceae bacterium]
MPKILFIAAHRLDRNPSQRYRFEQYLSFFEANGFSCELSNIISEKDDKIFYNSGNLLKKAGIVWKGILIRLKDVRRANEFDLIFIHREALMLGSTYFEKRFNKSKAKVIFDFDDAIWMLDTSAGNSKWKFLKSDAKTGKNIAYSDAVIAGNSFLANYALTFNKNVHIIPTTVDTEIFKLKNVKEKSTSICIGWSGSPTTIKHFEHLLGVLKKIKEKYGDKIHFSVMGDGNYSNPELGIQGIPWQSEKEVEEISRFDIGIMPLPNDAWSKGKCGLKGLTYMSLEVPTIMSAVGVNSEIIQDGENGFLASSEEEWIEKLSLLIESEELRQKIGKAGRKTVVESYSVLANQEKYLSLFKELLNK